MCSTSEQLELSHDIIEMDSIFESIAECKDDSQQRSWHLHDDEYYIQNQLSRLLEILVCQSDNLDPDLDLDPVFVLVYTCRLQFGYFQHPSHSL